MRPARAAAAAGLALLLAACDAPTVPALPGAYTYALPTSGSGTVLRWPSGSTIRVYAEGGDAAATAALARALDQGAAAWNATMKYGEFRIVAASAIEDADVVLLWTGVALPVETGQCVPDLTGVAVTTFCLATPPTRLEPFPIKGSAQGGRVKMLVQVLASLATDSARARRTVTHELGHVLGIGQHSPSEADLMNARASAPRLSPADQATVLALYHTRPDVVP
ncbi:MAG TPA: hypothetical protein VFQ38_24425 [Longimicrobiales bacterium]|nr:hypothetical protein [Longimicrobiales bacterium]